PELRATTVFLAKLLEYLFVLPPLQNLLLEPRMVGNRRQRREDLLHPASLGAGNKDSTAGVSTNNDRGKEHRNEHCCNRIELRAGGPAERQASDRRLLGRVVRTVPRGLARARQDRRGAGERPEARQGEHR